MMIFKNLTAKIFISALTLFLFGWYFFTALTNQLSNLLIIFGLILFLIIGALVSGFLKKIYYGYFVMVILGLIFLAGIYWLISYIPPLVVWRWDFNLFGWLIFYLCFIFHAFKTIVYLMQTNKPNFSLFISLIASIYFWLILLIFAPGPIIITLAFVALGFWVGIMIKTKILNKKFMALKKDARWRNLFLIIFTLLLLTTALFGFYQQLNSFPAKVLTPEIATVDSQTADYQKAKESLEQLRAFVATPNAPIDSQEFISQRDLLANKTVSLARQAVQVAPNDYRSWELYGDVASLFIQAKVPNAITEAKNAYERALALNPNEPKLEVKFAETLLQLGQQNYWENNLDESDTNFKSALALLSSDANVRYQLAIFYRDAKDLPRATGALDEALAIDPNHAEALALREQLNPTVEESN
ncbi:MAG: hypothetical protein AAB453_00780 [Patescibacteria group bacterium]